ncbi:MAG: PA-phosphatase [Peptococcaceae bacterium]
MLNYFEKIKEYKHFLLLAVWPVLLLFFFYCEKTVVAKYKMHCVFDDGIPLIKWFIIPYELWYIYLAAGFLFLGLKSKKDFVALCVLLYAGHMISYFFYLLFPNGQDLRPVIIGKDILSNMIRHLYSIDTPTNVFPSLHVYDSIIVFITSKNYLQEHKKYGILAGSFVIMVMASISTVFVKQHSVLDILGGIALAIAVYYLFCKCEANFKTRLRPGAKMSSTHLSS